jgi:hypothetical protein
MTPQSTFMILAPVERSRIEPLRKLLESMNKKPGMADPKNTLVPFECFGAVHFARFVVLDDRTTGDINCLYGLNRPEPPVYLAFLGDFDGDYDALMEQFVRDAEPGLREIFSFCEGFSESTDLRAWMAAHEQRPGAAYTNWVGRTVVQIREEEKLRQALLGHLKEFPELRDRPALEVHRALRSFMLKETDARRLQLTRPAPTPFGWRVRHMLDWITLIAVLILGPVALLVALLLFAWRLRMLEKSDKPYTPRPSPGLEAELANREDYDVTNQFSVMGALKPGPFRAVIVAVVLWAADLAARTLYTTRRLARIRTIHAARWVVIDNRTRMFFASNYDGSRDSYNDDFINKVGFGLNLVFSSGVGYPRTRWLLLDGAKDELAFKYILRRHQLATEVWYNAHPGLAAPDLDRNSQIRQGIEKPLLSDAEAREWVTLL